MAESRHAALKFKKTCDPEAPGAGLLGTLLYYLYEETKIPKKIIIIKERKEKISLDRRK